MKRGAALALALAAAFVGITWGALELSEVAVLRTQTPDGGARETRVWYVEQGGSIWIEAATPERAFLADTRHTPQVTLYTGTGSATYQAEVLDAASEHERVRTLLRRKYGVRDWWVALLQDTSHSVALRLYRSHQGSGTLQTDKGL